MSEQQDKISYLLDEFSDGAHCRSVLDEVESDVNLKYKMRRYLMIGEVIRHQLPAHINTNFSANIMAQIDQIENAADLSGNRTSSRNEPGLNDSSLNNGRSIWTWSMMKPLAGMAVAASVAVLAVTLWQFSYPGNNSGKTSEQIVGVDQKRNDFLVKLPVPSNAVTVSSSVDSGLRWKINNNTPALQQKLNAYLVNHTEYSNSMQGLIPQARVAGFDAQK